MFINWQITNYKNETFLTKLIRLNKQKNNINKIITAMTKNTSSNRSAFSQRQFNVDTYHNSTCIAAKSALALNRTTLFCVKRHYVMKSICGR